MTLAEFDLPIIQFLTSYVGQNNFIDHVLYAFASYDIFKGLVYMALLWGVWFYHTPNNTSEQQDKKQEHLLIVFVGSIAAVILSRILQVVLSVHKRPIFEDINITFPSIVDKTALNPWNSFPSDHAVLFFALAIGLWQANRLTGAFAFLWSVIIIGLPRIYLGIHYPSDIVAGALLGVAFMLIWVRLPLQHLAAWGINISKRYPGTFYMLAFFATVQVGLLFDDVRGMAEGVATYYKSAH